MPTMTDTSTSANQLRSLVRSRKTRGIASPITLQYRSDESSQTPPSWKSREQQQPSLLEGNGIRRFVEPFDVETSGKRHTGL